MSTLFLKYRPQTFSDLVGQSSIRKTLQNALKAERPSHAYMFSGSRGTGKTSTARIFAKGLICPNLKDGDPCGECDLCQGVADGSLVDIVEIDAASNRGIEEIRDLREKINFSPTIAKRKVYIIDEVHMLTKEAFNALLKTLEEPPDHAFFCLATTEIHKVPETILSRCQVFLFGRFTITQMVDRLKYISESEGYTAEEAALEIIAQKAEGGLRDAISLLEQVSAETEGNITEQATRESLGVSDSEKLESLYQSLMRNDRSAALSVVEDLAQVGADFRSFGHDFLNHLRNKMHEAVKDRNSTSLQKTLTAIEAFETALFRLKSSPIIELPFEIAIISICSGEEASNQTTKPSSKPQEKPQEKVSPPPVKEELEGGPSDDKKEAETSEPKATSQEPQAFSSSKVNTDLPTKDQVQSRMEEIAQKADLPAFVKKSFMTTIPSAEENGVCFYTDSEFHREKLETPAVKNSIKAALKDIFGSSIEVQFVKKAIERPAAETSTTNESASSNSDALVF